MFSSISPLPLDFLDILDTLYLKEKAPSRRTDQGMLEAFHEFIGVTARNEKGQVIGKDTLRALVAASKARAAGVSWKVAVTGSFFYPSNPVPKSKAESALNAVNTLQIRGDVYDTKDGTFVSGRGKSFRVNSQMPMFQAVRQAYITLGLMKEDESIEAGNYRFQVLSGVNEDPSKKNLFGPGTLNALLEALRNVSRGQEWVSLQTQNIVDNYSE